MWCPNIMRILQISTSMTAKGGSSCLLIWWAVDTVPPDSGSAMMPTILFTFCNRVLQLLYTAHLLYSPQRCHIRPLRGNNSYCPERCSKDLYRNLLCCYGVADCRKFSSLQVDSYDRRRSWQSTQLGKYRAGFVYATRRMPCSYKIKCQHVSITFRDAPPTRNPSMSSCFASSWLLAPFTEPAQRCHFK